MKKTALFGICLLAFTAFLDFTIVNTALPFIQRAFQIEILTLQWVSNIFPIIMSMSMIAVGKIGEWLGVKRVFYFGVVLFGTAALFAGLSANIAILIFWRGVQALGASITFVSSSALISEIFSSDERDTAIGIYGGITGAGLMVGPFLGGILIGLLDWRWVFWINLPLIAIGLFCCWISLKGKSRCNEEVQIDWKGLFFLIFGLGSMMYGIISSAANSGKSVLSWVFLILGVFAILFLLIVDLKAKKPLLNFMIFKDHLILLAVISCAVAGVVSYVFMFFDPLLLKDVFDLSPYAIGFLVAVIPAAQVIISFGFKPLLKSIGLSNLLLLSSFSPFISAIMQLFVTQDTSMGYFILPFALLGINWGLSNTAMICAINQNMKPSQIAEAIGTNATIWNFSGAILLAITTALFQLQKSSFLPAFRIAVSFNIIFMLLAIAGALWARLLLARK